jgi:hypothetical protein
MTNKQIEWCCVPVVVDDSVAELFHMAPPDRDAKQTPEFRVTETTLGLVLPDFDRYRPSLERMAAHWHEEKGREMSKAKALKKTRAA